MPTLCRFEPGLHDVRCAARAWVRLHIIQNAVERSYCGSLVPH